MLSTDAVVRVLGVVGVMVLSACTEGKETESQGEATAGQGASDTTITDFSCTPTQTSPYDATTPYLGIHGDAGNSDVIPCDTANDFEQAWHVLQGHAIAQPNTFSPDGSRTYVTAFPALGVSDCTLFALDAGTGETLWCKALHRSVVGSSVEVDEEGMLYVGAASAIYSYTPEGDERWKTVLDSGDGESLEQQSFGLHFSQTGHVVTVTITGRLVFHV